MTTAISAQATRRKGIATNLIHVPVIFGNQLLNSGAGSRFGSYAKMADCDSADWISPGRFFDRVARRLLVTLHSTSILRFCSFSLWPQVPARILKARPVPARRALSTVEPPTQKRCTAPISATDNLDRRRRAIQWTGGSRQDHPIDFDLITSELLITSTLA